MDKLNMKPLEEWNEKDHDFMKVSSDPKMLELIRIHC